MNDAWHSAERIYEYINRFCLDFVTDAVGLFRAVSTVAMWPNIRPLIFDNVVD